MTYDPVLGDPTPDSANEGRAKWNAMSSELDSRLAAVEGEAPRHQILELEEDALSHSTTFMNTGLGFPVETGIFYNFFAMLLWSPENFDPLWSGSQPTGHNTIGAIFSVNGPGSTPSPVTWLHYQAMTFGYYDNDWPSWFYSQYDSGDYGLGSYSGDYGSVGDRVAIVRGFVQPPSDGTFAFRFRCSGVQSNGLIVRAGSTVEVW